MNVKEILIAAKAKIANPEHWTQGVCARDAEGREVHNTSERAVCWCSMGAIWSSAEGYGNGAQAGNVLSLQLPGCSLWAIPEYNDTHTHAEVMALFDKAIESCDK